MMLRTQIYLPAEHLRILKKLALQEEVSLSEIIRRLIEEKLTKKEERNTGSWLLTLADKAKKLKIKGPKDLASRVDFYLYGRK